MRGSVFRNANPSNLRGSLLEGNKDHLLNQARSDLAKHELHVESLNKCIGELQRQTEEQRLALQDLQYGFVESRRDQVQLQEELSMKEKVLRKNSNREYARDGRNEESSRTTNRCLSEKINRKSPDNPAAYLPIAANAEQMNSMNDSVVFFKDVESNYSGCLTFPVTL